MKTSPKIALILVVAVLGMAGLGMLTSAWGGEHGARGGWSMSDGKGKQCDRHGSDYGKHKRWSYGSDRLAKKLSVMETEIGIRANQLDAWRDFTDALLALMKPPMAGGLPAMSEPFSLPEFMADRTIARAKSAESLKSVIGKLRTTLTPEQLEKVKTIEAELRQKFERCHHGMKSHFAKPSSDERAGDEAAPPPTPDEPATEDKDEGAL
ncbi:MAG: hypothetical protein ACREDO_00255 [Methyloceanibacter sp.]